MKTKLERIKVMEDELAELKLQVKEETKIKVGCVVKTDMCFADVEDRLVVSSMNNILLVSLTTGRRVNCLSNISKVVHDYTFVASSLEEYFKGK